MKKVSLIALFSLSVAMQAQTDAHITASGTNFVQPVTDKNWSNRNGNDFTSANFKQYTGETFVSIRVDKETAVAFDFQVMTRKGDLRLTISGNGQDLDLAELSAPFDRNYVSEGKTTLTLQPGTEYRLRLIGNNAKGMLKCKWAEVAPEMVSQ